MTINRDISYCEDSIKKGICKKCKRNLDNYNFNPDVYAVWVCNPELDIKNNVCNMYLKG